MNTMVSLTLLLGVAQLHAAPQYAASQYAAAEYPDEKPLYRYEYSVNDNENGPLTFNAVENRDGTDASGSYSVLLPDSRIQTVTYTVDPVNGFLAQVTYSGEARFDPVPVYKPAASYSPPPSYSAAPSYPAAPSYSSARAYSEGPAPTEAPADAPVSEYPSDPTQFLENILYREN